MTCVLVVAKAPVAGVAKTRLSPEIGYRAAARLAAASLVDTLEAVLGTPGTDAVVAMTGSLADSEYGDEVARALGRCMVISQRGRDFGARLANAHADTGALHPGRAVFQIGMDTPQVSPELLGEAIEALHGAGVDAVLGPATDGGWWGLGLRSPDRAAVLRAVPMSRPDTGVRTENALRGNGLRVERLRELSDVDTMADAVEVAALVPDGRFGRELRGLLVRA
jgi:glycosyltransferase A (GT-A) superfamily protein (DUF2064 family)